MVVLLTGVLARSVTRRVSRWSDSPTEDDGERLLSNDYCANFRGKPLLPPSTREGPVSSIETGQVTASDCSAARHGRQCSGLPGRA